MESRKERVEFRTIDGLTLVGFLFPAFHYGPAIIMSIGGNLVKEMFLPNMAREFQHNGITALIYDARHVGESEGYPRNELNPEMQVSDYSDALTYLQSHALVNPDEIVFWGYSWSGSIALSAASVDKRAKVCVCIGPFARNSPQVFERVAQMLPITLRDRESQLAENEPAMITWLDAEGHNPIIPGRVPDEYMGYFRNAQKYGFENYKNHVTLQSLYKIVLWNPSELHKLLTSTPVLIIVPTSDELSLPGDQKDIYNGIPGPKEMYLAEGKGHFDLFSGDGLEHICKLQADFIKKHL